MTHPHQPIKHSAPRVIYRWVSGRALDGRQRTDATYLHDATRVLTVSGRASKWARLAGWKRQAIRHGVTVAAAAGAVGYAVAPTLTVIVAETSAAGAVTAGIVKGRRAWRRRHAQRRYARPLAALLGQVIGQPLHSPDTWLHVPTEITGPPPAGPLDRIPLPAWWPGVPQPLRKLASVARRRRPARGAVEGWALIPPTLLVTPEIKRTVGQVLAAKLGTDDLTIAWNLVGATPTLTFHQTPRPPASVVMGDIIDAIGAASDAAPVIGVGAGGSIVAVDLDTESPHAAISCGSGAGKSVLLRGLIAQWLHNGAQVTILDGKRVSQSWCADLPGVTYCRTGEAMHNAIVDLAADVDRRFNILENAHPDEDQSAIDVGPRQILVFEEQNIGMQMLREYWAIVREKEDPKRSPALSALDYILCAGRQAKSHVVSVAQLFTVVACGGNPAARENYGARVLSRATRNAWLMLAPECGPNFPRQVKRRGRMQLALSGDVTEVQVALWTEKEARVYATSGVAPVTVPATWTVTPGQRHEASRVTSDGLVSLADAARQRVVPLTYGSLRNAKTKDGDAFPQGVTVGNSTKYRKSDLIAWFEARNAAAVERENAGEIIPADVITDTIDA